MSKPRIVAIKRKETPAPQQPVPTPITQEGTEPSGGQSRPSPSPRILEEADWSLLVRQVKDREDALKRENPQSADTALREQAMKDILPTQVGPGQPFEIAKRRIKEALDRATGRARKPPAQSDQGASL